MDSNQYISMDPNILVSIINMKLRDFYSSLEVLCDDMDISKDTLEEKLSQVGYTYDKDINQFR